MVNAQMVNLHVNGWDETECARPCLGKVWFAHAGAVGWCDDLDVKHAWQPVDGGHVLVATATYNRETGSWTTQEEA